MESSVKLSKTIFNGTRLNITVCITMPEVVKNYRPNDYSIISSPIMFISYKPPKGFDIDKKACFYKVTPRNLYRTAKFFNAGVEWFYDKELSDLFLLDENNALVFNADYAHLKVVTDRDHRNNTAMKMIPSVIQYEDGNVYEGVLLYINKPEYVAPLPLADLEAILGIFRNFSFEACVTEMLISYFIARSENKINQTSHDYSNNQW